MWIFWEYFSVREIFLANNWRSIYYDLYIDHIFIENTIEEYRKVIPLDTITGKIWNSKLDTFIIANNYKSIFFSASEKKIIFLIEEL